MLHQSKRIGKQRYGCFRVLGSFLAHLVLDLCVWWFGMLKLAVQGSLYSNGRASARGYPMG